MIFNADEHGLTRQHQGYGEKARILAERQEPPLFIRVHQYSFAVDFIWLRPMAG